MAGLGGMTLWELVKHALRWVTNLKRARDERRRASIKALRQVISASRKTAVYIRRLRNNGKPSVKKEEELALLWTDLGFSLEDLGLKKLAKRCDLKGKHWAASGRIDGRFLKKAEAGLRRMEDMARAILRDVPSGQTAGKRHN